MILSAVDAILILTRTPEYYQIADDAPFTSTEIERERLRLLTELLVRPYLIDYMFHGSPSTNFDQGGRQKKKKKKSMNIIKKNF